MNATQSEGLLPVEQRHRDLAQLVIPAVVIFADAPDHVADLRRRAAEHIARFERDHLATTDAREVMAAKRALATAIALEVDPRRNLDSEPLQFCDRAWIIAEAGIEAALATTDAVPLTFYDSGDRGRRLTGLADLIEQNPGQRLFSIVNAAQLAADLRHVTASAGVKVLRVQEARPLPYDTDYEPASAFTPEALATPSAPRPDAGEMERLPDALIERIEKWLAHQGGFRDYASRVLSGTTGWSQLRSKIWLEVYDLFTLAQPAPAMEEVERLREELAWYGEQARLARLIHSEGDAGRHALADDGGKRARAALSPESRS